MDNSAWIQKLDELFTKDLTICDQLNKLLIADGSGGGELKKIDEILIGISAEKFNNLVNKAVNRNDALENYLKQIENVHNDELQEIIKLQDELKELEEKLDKLKIERSKVENVQVKADELAHIDVLKNKLKLYKLLMNVHFSYESQTLTGYIQNKSNLIVFDFDKTRMSSKEIVEEYWNKLENAAGIDCKQIANDILNS